MIHFKAFEHLGTYGLNISISICCYPFLKFVHFWVDGMQLVAPWIQERRIIWAKHRYRRNHALHRVSDLTNQQNWGSLFTPEGDPDEDVLKK